MPLGDLEAEVYRRVLVVRADVAQSILRDHLRRTAISVSRPQLPEFEAKSVPRASIPTASSSIWHQAALKRVRSRESSQSDHVGDSARSSSDEPGEETFSLGFNDAFKKPFDGQLWRSDARLISQKKADEP